MESFDPGEFFRMRSDFLGRDAPPGEKSEWEKEKESLMKEANQDVDTEEVASTLEDPALVDHMRRAREEYRRHEAYTRSTGPNEAQVRGEFVDLLELLRAAADRLDECIVKFSTAADEVYICARQMGEAAEGRANNPHFPPEKLPPPELVQNPALSSFVAKGKQLFCNRSDALKGIEKEFREVRNQVCNCRSAATKIQNEAVTLLRQNSDLIDSQRRLLSLAEKVYRRDEISLEESLKAVTQKKQEIE